jgi:hypothetical protein
VNLLIASQVARITGMSNWQQLAESNFLDTKLIGLGDWREEFVSAHGQRWHCRQGSCHSLYDTKDELGYRNPSTACRTPGVGETSRGFLSFKH